MPGFDKKIFNAEAFGRYVDTIPRVKQNQFLKAGVLATRNDLKTMLTEQTGGNYVTVPMFGRIGGEALNYDGATNITADNMDTYSQSMVVVGRAKAWTELDFSADITGEDFMNQVASQVADYWDDIDQNTMLSVLAGIFGTSNAFVTNHTYDITGEAEPNVGATTLNSAIQKACGANKGIFKVVIMHSAVATNLENISAVEYLKYTDTNGAQRNLGMATWNGKIILIDDEVPALNGYDTSTQGAEGALLVGTDITVTNVKKGDFYPSTVNDGDYVVAHTKYTSYVLGDGAFTFCDCGAKVPYEMDRNPMVNGGQDYLITRQRKLFAPYGFSFTKKVMTSLSPTDAELENAQNWELVKSSEGNVIDHKAIPICKIVSLG